MSILTRADDGPRVSPRVDRVAAAGALLALAAGAFAPFVMVRANRIVGGVAVGLLATGPVGWAVLAASLVALACALLPSGRLRGDALAAAAAALTVAAAWACGRAAVVSLAGAGPFARVSLASGAWLIAAAAAVVWFAASRAQGSRAVLVAARAVAVAGSAAAAVLGGLARLSIVAEFEAQRGVVLGALATHLAVAGVSLSAAVLLGVPLGVASARFAPVRTAVLGVAGLIQTIPSLALLGLLVFPLVALGLPGIGALPAVIALTLYALLPVVRTTYLGIAGVDPAITDAGRGMGMSPLQVLVRVEAPLALPMLIEGVRAAAVLVIGIAAIVAFIGVGSLGVLVFQGWGQQADDLILLGAVPMVLLAVIADVSLRALRRAVVSPGIGGGAT